MHKEFHLFSVFITHMIGAAYERCLAQGRNLHFQNKSFHRVVSFVQVQL